MTPEASNSSKKSDWAYTRSKFIEAGGSTTQSFGLGRLIGQIYALLYLAPAPLALEEIAQQLGVSKASISVTIRQMESWQAVHKIWVKGDRRDFYECEPDFRAILKQGILPTLRKKLETAGTQLEHVATLLQAQNENGDESDEGSSKINERLEKARKFQRQISSIVDNPLIKHLL